MSTSVNQPDGLGDMQAGPAPDSQTTAANANQDRQGFAALRGPRSERDVTWPKSPSIAPPAQPATKWAPPKQPVGNPKKGQRL